ncbi:hypothetical protein LCL95_06185 [Bacillus timonensis]|nr:hypothetical protein [Bacillus timonensis]
MDEKLLQKMIRNCFYQYNHDLSSVPLTQRDYEELYRRIKEELAIHASEDLHDIINNVVYEFLTT